MRITIFLTTMLFVTPSFAESITDAAVSTVDSFEKMFGVTPGKRRNHTKGFCFEGTLSPSDVEIIKLSNSSIFTGESTVTGRLSHKGGNNLAPDNKPGEYGMGLAITSRTGDLHLMSMNTLDFFPVATPQAFAELSAAKVKGKEAVKAFKAKSADLQRFKAHAANKDKTLKPYEGNTYNSVNSFYLVSKHEKKTAVRWAFVPVGGQAILLEPNEDFFFANMQKNLSEGSVVWDMVVTIADSNDDVDNAAIPWQGDREQVVAARLTVNSISSEQGGKCDVINYDPLVLSAGFEPSNDPLLQARSTSYAISSGKRNSEKQ